MFNTTSLCAIGQYYIIMNLTEDLGEICKVYSFFVYAILIIRYPNNFLNKFKPNVNALNINY